MAHASEDRPVRDGSRTRVLIAVLIVILILMLVGLLYVLWSVTSTPERTPILAQPPGIELVFQSLGGGAAGPVDRPYDVACDGDDAIYVTLPSKSRILVFDGDGENGRVFAEDVREEDDARALAEYKVLRPLGIDVGPDGSVYVADADKMAVLVFSPEGEKLREVPVMVPKCLDVTGDRIYVLSELSTLFVMDLDGNALGQWGTRGRGLDEMVDPAGVVVDEEGIIYISDMNNYRVVALSPELERIWQYGGAASTAAELNARELAAPAGIALGGDGNLYLVDGLNSQIRVFDREGNSVSGALGSHGQSDDEFYFPAGIDWLEDDLFVMADSFHDRIVGVRITPQAVVEGVEQ